MDMYVEDKEAFKSAVVEKTLTGAQVSGDDLILHFESGKVRLVAFGDCCAVSYFGDLERPSRYPAKVAAWEESSGESEHSHDVTDIAFLNLLTDTGPLRVTMRTVHNGHYGGWYEIACDVDWFEKTEKSPGFVRKST